MIGTEVARAERFHDVLVTVLRQVVKSVVRNGALADDDIHTNEPSVICSRQHMHDRRVIEADSAGRIAHLDEQSVDGPATRGVASDDMYSYLDDTVPVDQILPVGEQLLGASCCR